jgi:NitT/TauT family transport system substrate-binding protein
MKNNENTSTADLKNPSINHPLQARIAAFKKWHLLLGLFFVLGVAWLISPKISAWLTPLSKVTIAVPTQINSAPMIVASAQGLFEKANVEVVTQPFLLGKDALKSVLDGKADLAVVADTPFMFAVFGGNDVVILACISQGRRALAVVAHADHGISKPQDLAGKSVGLTMGANFPYFLDAMLESNRVDSASIKRVNLKTEESITAFKAGAVDAAVVFQPYLAQLQIELGTKMQTFYAEDVYAFRFMLVGKPAYIDSHPEEVERILKALMMANQAIRSDPEKARKQVGEVVKVDDAIMSKLFEPADYEISLDQAMLTALDDQTRWAMKQNIVKAGPMPNYLSLLKYKNLEAVSPAAVRIVR